ncbi:MAG: hypothetical protein ACM3TR_11160 [Caulobacteraceae bacterium]
MVTLWPKNYFSLSKSLFLKSGVMNIRRKKAHTHQSSCSSKLPTNPLSFPPKFCTVETTGGIGGGAAGGGTTGGGVVCECDFFDLPECFTGTSAGLFRGSHPGLGTDGFI